MKTKNLKFDALRTLAEEMVGKKTDSRISVAHEEVNGLIHELQVHQAELELQNEELRGLQNDLEKSRNRYYELFDSAPVGYIIIDAHYTIIEINSTALEQLGRPRQEMVGRPLLNSVRTGDHTRMVSFLRTIATSRERHEILIDLTTADGSIVNARIDAVRSEGEDKEHCRHLLTLTDLTELQKARETIEKSESIYRALVQSSADHIFLMSSEGRYLASNDNVAQLGAKDGSELIGRHFSEVLPSEVAELYREKFSQVVATQQPAAFEHDLPVDETCIFHHDKLYPIFRGGTFWAVGGTCRDTTDQKTAQRRNEKLEADLRQQQKLESLGTLAGGIAHDFNNILTSLIGYTELSLSEVEKGSPMEEYLQEMLQAGLRAKNLVAQILAFSRKSDEELRPVRIDKIAREVMKLIRPSLPSTIEIVFAAESNSVILGNATQVHQILMNLCTNAAHAMQEKGGVLTIAIRDVILGEGDPGGGREDGHSVEIEVTDTGSGIAPDIIDRVYEPYFTTKGLGTGTGMGLAVVHGILIDS
jgi:PAS domain S-box-containing protein